MPKFNDQALGKWLDYILKIWEFIAIAFLIAFPFILDVSYTVKQSMLKLLDNDESSFAYMSLQDREKILNSLSQLIRNQLFNL